MKWTYNQELEAACIYGYGLDNSAQTFPYPAPDLGWSALAEIQGSTPIDVTASCVSPRTQVNYVAVQAGPTRATSTRVPHQQIALNSRIDAYSNIPQGQPVISRGRNNTRSRARRSQVSSSPSHSPDDLELKCKWEGCRYTGTFNREHSLIRHIRNIHISPFAHPCLVQGCGQVFNRADNLLQHKRNNHITYP
ncbi:hypothetical protein N7475_005079 [Penicillium sp. IBT 31633x]|nr:hypothetical protein N7475_005079 [Penicillium sp. IBT 31633x]